MEEMAVARCRAMAEERKAEKWKGSRVRCARRLLENKVEAAMRGRVCEGMAIGNGVGKPWEEVRRESRWSPTRRGAAIGAVEERVLPVEAVGCARLDDRGGDSARVGEIGAVHVGPRGYTLHCFVF